MEMTELSVDQMRDILAKQSGEAATEATDGDIKELDVKDLEKGQ